MSNKNKLQNYNNSNAVVRQSVSYSGPLPPPDVLKQFDLVCPGSAQLIIETFKNQTEHRQGLEKNVIASDIQNSKLGLCFGFTIGLVGLVAGAFVIIFGHPIAGCIVDGATLGGLVGTFVYGSQGRKKEREIKK